MRSFLINKAIQAYNRPCYGVLCLFIIPVIIPIILLSCGTDTHISDGMTLTIASIFIGFYLTLIISINSKISSFSLAEINDEDGKAYSLRYINFAHEYMALIFIGLISILAVVVLQFLIKLDFNLQALSVTLYYLYYFFIAEFIISVISNIFILLSFVKEDYKHSYEKIKNKKITSDE